MRRIPPTWQLPLACLAALIPVLAIAVLRWSDGPGAGVEDYAQYLLHARALAAGRHYADTGLLGLPSMPPGLPMMLAAFIRVFGEHMVAIRLLMLAMSVGAFVAGSLYFMLYDDRRLGLGVLLLVGLAPAVVAFSSHVLSDLPFWFAIWLVLLVADRPGVWSWPRVAAIAVLGLGAIGIREVGIALIPAGLGVAATRWRELRWRGLVPPLVWAGAIILAVAVGGWPRITKELDWLEPLTLLQQLLKSLRTYRLSVAETLLYPFSWSLANDAWHVIALLLAVAGLGTWIRGASGRLALWFCVFYSAMLLLLPFAEARYMWVVIPLLLFGLMRGVAWLVSRVPPLRTRLDPATAALAFAVLLALGGVVQVLRSPDPGSFAEGPAARELFAVVRRLEPDSMRIAFVRPRILVLETGARAMKTVGSGVARLDLWLDRQCITHLISGSQGLGTRLDSVVQAAIMRRPEQFVPIYANDAFTMYRYGGLRPERTNSISVERCQALARAAIAWDTRAR